MKSKIAKEFKWEMSHRLPYHQGPCKNLHGHTYKLEVVVKGDIRKDGMLMDFNELKEVVNSSILDLLDHSNLNDLFENPTAENIASWILNELKKEIPVYSVKLWEGHGKWVEVCRN